jgi:hypothetical protein
VADVAMHRGVAGVLQAVLLHFISPLPSVASAIKGL